MKRPQKLIVRVLLSAMALVCLWCLLVPILFPKRVAAVNAAYQKAIAPKAAATK